MPAFTRAADAEQGPLPEPKICLLSVGYGDAQRTYL